MQSTITDDVASDDIAASNSVACSGVDWAAAETITTAEGVVECRGIVDSNSADIFDCWACYFGVTFVGMDATNTYSTTLLVSV